MSASSAPKMGLKETVGPSFGAGGDGGGGGGNVSPWEHPDATTRTPCLFCSLALAFSPAFRNVMSVPPTISPKSLEAAAAHPPCLTASTTHWWPPLFTQSVSAA